MMKRRPRARQPITSAEQKQMPKYPIGVVSQLVGLPPQMLRRYEEAGLLAPVRQDGKNRLYSDQDVAILEEIAELAELGVNAAGIRYILQMRREIFLLRQEVQQARQARPIEEEGSHEQEEQA